MAKRTTQKIAAPQSKTLTAKAVTDAQLPDGTFVPKGGTVQVTKEFANRLLTERDKRFIISY